MAAKRAAFFLRRLRALGFSKRRRRRKRCSVCSRSSRFLSRRMARSTGSPFFTFTSVIIQVELVAQQGLARHAIAAGLLSGTRAPEVARHLPAPPRDRAGQRLA